MNIPRRFHGLWWYTAQHSVFVFGGETTNQSTLTALVDCECWDSQDNIWREEASMAKPRYCFNPCEFGSFIYLCGGQTDCIEAFNPRTRLCRELQDVQLPVSTRITISFVACNQLVVLSQNGVTYWDISQGHLA